MGGRAHQYVHVRRTSTGRGRGEGERWAERVGQGGGAALIHNRRGDREGRALRQGVVFVRDHRRAPIGKSSRLRTGLPITDGTVDGVGTEAGAVLGVNATFAAGAVAAGGGASPRSGCVGQARPL